MQIHRAVRRDYPARRSQLGARSRQGRVNLQDDGCIPAQIGRYPAGLRSRRGAMQGSCGSRVAVKPAAIQAARTIGAAPFSRLSNLCNHAIENIHIARVLVGSLGRFGWLVIQHPGWTGNESISRNPSRVPILDSCTAHGAFKAADLAQRNHVLAAIIDRAAFTGSMTRRF